MERDKTGPFGASPMGRGLLTRPLATRSPAWRGRRCLVTLLGIGLLLSTGCTDRDPQVMYVLYNQAVDRGTQCLAQGNVTRPIGWFDIGITNKYLLFPAVSNNLPTSESVTNQSAGELRLNNSTIQVTGGTVYYDVPPDLDADLAAQGVPLPQGQFVFTSGSVESETTGAFVLEVVPPLVGELLRRSDLLSTRYAATQILVRVTLEGVLPNGQVVNSNEFVYPLNICNGCLVYFPVTDCCAQSEAEILLPCFPGQDEGLDCRGCCQLATSPQETAICLPGK